MTIETGKGAGRLPAQQLTLGRVMVSAVSQLAIGLVIIYATGGVDALRALAALPAPSSLGLGLAVGVGIAALQGLLLRAWPAWRTFSQRAIAGTALKPGDIVLIGVAVGVAEEVLFRAALQPLIGLWLTSLLFAIVHWNYAALLGPQRELGRSLLAIATIFAMSVVLGLLYERAGLAAAIVAHAAYDIIVLSVYRALFRW